MFLVAGATPVLMFPAQGAAFEASVASLGS